MKTAGLALFVVMAGITLLMAANALIEHVARINFGGGL